MTTIVTKSLRGFCLGMAVSLILPFSVLAETAVEKFDRNRDGMIDRIDWRYMKDDDKITFVRMSLEEMGENPATIVFKGKTREQLLLESFEAIYGQ